MLTKWKLFNFKAIQRETELEFKPLTIFAGANSSGKSTVLQSILLVAQSLGNQVTNRPLVLNGDLVRLGQFDDLLSMNSESSAIMLGWSIEPRLEAAKLFSVGVPSPFHQYAAGSTVSIQEIQSEIIFNAKSGTESPEVLQLQPTLLSGSLSITTKQSDVGSNTTAVGFRQKDVIATSEDFGGEEEAIGGLAHDRSLYTVKFDPTTENARRIRTLNHTISGLFLKNFLPDSLVAQFEGPALVTEAIMRALTGRADDTLARSGFPDLIEVSMPKTVLELISSCLSLDNPLADRLKRLCEGEEPVNIKKITGIVRRTRLMGENRPQVLRNPDEFESLLFEHFSTHGVPTKVLRPMALPEQIAHACNVLKEWFVSGVKYLGPLRDEPKPIYPLVANIDPRDVGLRGEHTAAVLHIHRRQLIHYLPSKNFDGPRISPDVKPRSLESAVSDWLIYLGVASEVSTRDLGKLGYEMQVKLSDDDIPHDLTHVGVGVSQVLPIVVSCLLAEADSLLIFEQPELHLHPKVQTLLADFFLSMAMLGRQCVLETHSEYLINRLRFRAAAAEGRQMIDTMQVYFVEKSGGQASFRKVAINEYGAILEWPKGFFDQSQSEAQQTLKAAFAKKAEERSSQ